MRELFVWYRVRDHDAPAARDTALAMQRSLVARCPGLEARLLIRDVGGGVQTWMETYARSASAANDGVDAATEALIDSASAALQDLTCGTRHVEAFEPVVSR